MNLQAPPSKSVTHRMLLLAAQTDALCTIRRPLRSADTDATMECLRALGADASEGEDNITFRPAMFTASDRPLDCRNAGTALRLLLGTAARLDAPVTLDGDASLRSRPNASLLEVLQQLGARIDSNDGRCPITVQGPIQPGDVALPPLTSSQFASSLLLSLPMLDGPSILTLQPPITSAPYIDLSLDVAKAFGLSIERDGDGFHIPGGQHPRGGTYTVEGDWSSAAFPLVAATITQRELTVQGLDLNSRQGDRAIIGILQAFGVKIRTRDGEVTVHAEELQSPGVIDVAATPDLFPILAVLAACSHGTTTFTGGASLRVKESDRIAAMATGLAACGIQVQEQPDGMTVHGGTLQGGKVHAHHDHRIHMAFRIADLVALGSIDVDGAETAAVSYPDFNDHLTAFQEVAA